MDWSGAEEEKAQFAGIWLAEAESGSLNRLRNGLTRDEAVAVLVNEIESGREVVVGLDFAFSFPDWYFKWRNLGSVLELWDLADRKGDEWLSGDIWPFWGKTGSKYQKRPIDLIACGEFRRTEKDHMSEQPKSVFKHSLPGAVGAGTIRGLPKLAEMRKAGGAIWPFDGPESGGATVVEIYPRLFYGRRTTNDGSRKGRDCRVNHLQARYPNLERHWWDLMVGSADAFDAGVSALAMSAHVENFSRLERATDQRTMLEGEIWFPS